jgi:hypothetical protein
MSDIQLSDVESNGERQTTRVKRPYKKLLRLSEEEMNAIKIIARAYNVDATNAIRIAVAELARKLQSQSQ